jgi:Tol biopolymer transport system component
VVGDQNQGFGHNYVSADGRYVAFNSLATGGIVNILVRDRQAGVTECVSIATDGTAANSFSESPTISADGRFVAFTSWATNLVSGDTNGWEDIFVHDRQTGVTECVSLAVDGSPGNLWCESPAISADGRFVAFTSSASNLVVGDTNGQLDVFIRDRLTGTTERVSVDSSGAEANYLSDQVSITPDGRYCAFASAASSLVPADTNGRWDVFVRDRQLGTTERVSLDSSGTQGNGNSGVSEYGYLIGLSISDDGRYVAFGSDASNLVSGDTNYGGDIFVRDRLTGTTERVSVASGGAQWNNVSQFPSISPDGRHVWFESCVDPYRNPGWLYDIYVHDRQSGTTDLVSISTAGLHANRESYSPCSSADGRIVGFNSRATNIVMGDTNNQIDTFVRDMDATSFTSLCTPGSDGVIACPCSNPPSAVDRGCDNSAATGGASFSASGLAHLSTDNLVLTTSGEPPTATSVLLQGTASPSVGLAFGQGVRCVAGKLRRLYTKTASGGSITVPGVGDPTISARSAAKGDVIQPAQSRWYLVYYHDPIVLGGCPANHTLNTTQTGQVTWWP